MFTFQICGVIPRISGRISEFCRNFAGLIGLMLGGLVLIYYGLVTLWPAAISCDDNTKVIILFASLITGAIGLRNPSGYWRDGHFKADDPGPGPFSRGLGLVTVPIWLGTIVYAAGNWFGVWASIARIF